MITRRHLLLSFVSSSILLASIINTPVSAYNYIGDVNLDNEVNSSDASQILIHSALVGSGNPSMFTDQQLALSDFNHDNTTDASDAAAILIASASIGAGDNVELETQPVVTNPPVDNGSSSDGGFVPSRGSSYEDTDWTWDGSDPGDANYATDPPADTDNGGSSNGGGGRRIDWGDHEGELITHEEQGDAIW